MNQTTSQSKLDANFAALLAAADAISVNALDVDGRNGVYIDRELFNDLCDALAQFDELSAS